MKKHILLIITSYEIRDSAIGIVLTQKIERNSANNWKIKGVTILIPSSFTGSLFTKLATGNISGTVDGDESEFAITGKSLTGKDNLKDTTEGNKVLKAKTNLGDINIVFISNVVFHSITNFFLFLWGGVNSLFQ